MTTREQQIEVIRKKCIEANPDILKLEFGCKVLGIVTNEVDCSEISRIKPAIIINALTTKTIQVLYYSDLQSYKNELIPTKGIEILGRDIRWSDLCSAFQYAKRQIHIDMYGLIQYEWGGKYFSQYYDLEKDNITHQSDETVEFIAKVLGWEEQE